jgi:hypothetical protein
VKRNVIGPTVLAILGSANIDGKVLRLTCGQVDRKLYVEVDDVLRNLGGKWNRKLGGHEFADDPRDALDDVLLTGSYARLDRLGYFPTPPELADQLVKHADIDPTMTVLEPSAGQGALCEALVRLGIPTGHIWTCEALEQNRRVLEQKRYTCTPPHDFLSWPVSDAVQFDRCVMNPPFARQQDIDHVLHAWRFLKPGGVLASIMAAGVTFRGDRKATEFRAFVEQNGWIRPNPPGSFRASGTDVGTVIVRLDKVGRCEP